MFSTRFSFVPGIPAGPTCPGMPIKFTPVSKFDQKEKTSTNLPGVPGKPGTPVLPLSPV